MFAGRAGGESTGGPEFCGAADEAVVTMVLSEAVVEVGGDVVLGKGFLSSKLLIEEGGLTGISSDLLGGRGAAMVVESRRSIAGLLVDGGILMLARSVIVVFVSI